MLWHLWVWDPAFEHWIEVGDSVDGVSDKVRQAVMWGLLQRFKGGQIYALHKLSGRTERYWLSGTLGLQRVG